MKLPGEELEEKIDGKLDKSGGTLTGTLNTRNVIPTNTYSNLGNETYQYGSYLKFIELYNSSPYIDFHYNSSSSDYTSRIIESSSGALTALNSISSGSDKRLKENIEEIDDKYIELLDKLVVKSYNFNKSGELKDCGLIAQEVLEAEKELGIDESVLIRGTGEKVTRTKNGEEKEEIDYYSLNYNNLTALLLKKVQLLEKRIKDLEK